MSTKGMRFHRHRCPDPKCGTIWRHAKIDHYDIHRHMCPRCGEVQDTHYVRLSDAQARLLLRLPDKERPVQCHYATIRSLHRLGLALHYGWPDLPTKTNPDCLRTAERLEAGRLVAATYEGYVTT